MIESVNPQWEDLSADWALYYQLAPVAHVAAVRGPVPVSQGTSGYASWNIHEWELV